MKIMDRLERLRAHFDSRKVNKTQFQNEMRKYSPRFSRNFLNMILKGERNLTDRTWGLLCKCLKWDTKIVLDLSDKALEWKSTTPEKQDRISSRAYKGQEL